MAETLEKHPLYHEVTGGSGHNMATIRWNAMDSTFHDSAYFEKNYNKDYVIARLEGATLRGSKESGYELKVYHPTYVDGSGDACSLAYYRFWGLDLRYAGGTGYTFYGLLTAAHHWNGEEIPFEYKSDDSDPNIGRRYLPPKIESDLLPMSIELHIYPKARDNNG